MHLRQLFLLLVGLGLIPVALSYGVNPQRVFGGLYGVDISATVVVHVLRAVMGLYLALAMFWILAAFRQSLERAALFSLVVFMFGLAAGRILSLLIDGSPHWLFSVYLSLEIVIGTAGTWLIQSAEVTATN